MNAVRLKHLEAFVIEVLVSVDDNKNMAETRDLSKAYNINLKVVAQKLLMRPIM